VAVPGMRGMTICAEVHEAPLSEAVWRNWK